MARNNERTESVEVVVVRNGYVIRERDIYGGRDSAVMTESRVFNSFEDLASHLKATLREVEPVKAG
jgi:hypothetical protein